MSRALPPVLLVEDRDSLRAVLRETLVAEGFDVRDVPDGTSAVASLRAERFLAVVTDLRLPGESGHEVLEAAKAADPDLPVILMTAYGTVEDAVRAMKSGAYDFLSKPVDPDHLVLALRRAVERRSLVSENLWLREALAERLALPEIVGDSPAMVRVSAQVRRVAPTDATVLLTGESGTGKELFARAVHHLGGRRAGPFVAINCAAIPETLIESELFGHERGAFTGADRAKPGKLELADGGTLFLDEVGELHTGVQAKLLRVLQERVFERVGGQRQIEVDLRVVAATNRDLPTEIAAGRFREDLYYRLAVVTLEIPPLRERGDDVARLATAFVRRYGREQGRVVELSQGARDALAGHSWPGNVRELQNCIERAVILCDADVLEAPHLGLAPTRSEAWLDGFRAAVDLRGGLDEVGARARDLAESIRIREALVEADGNRTRAAEALDVNYKRLLSRIRDLGIDPG